MSDEKFGSFDDLADVAEENLRPIVRELRRVILEIDPNACEVVRIGDKAATYGLGPKKRVKVIVIFFPTNHGLIWVSIRELTCPILKPY